MSQIKLRHIVGSGHLHGMSAPGLDLEIALEPDALHRETQRRLSTRANAHNQPLVLKCGYTNLGQLDHLTLRSPNTTSQQSYQNDALGRMSFRSLEGDPAEKVIAYRFDAAGRLIGSQHDDYAHREHPSGERLTLGYDGANPAASCPCCVSTNPKANTAAKPPPSSAPISPTPWARRCNCLPPAASPAG
ncbi:hypothetical protein [Halomonas llamarensis]|uniref:YD repeat-containing protein n=1 Tax=Halomonas llamarensis TaxID=2945104 RepID=A0ABT0SRG4_9GAMM|nr:hypothetical protein [Halomonas llamarensis]MCL7930417.1 hypothetical protein [Halomonas llamarensis]